MAIQVADALEHASQREVVHRDIKPSNIVITPAGRARIVDMGLARLHQVAGDADLTVSGMTLGTFDYISPEQARDPRAADVRSDLYSLGCTMFFMLAGRPPFAEGTMVQKLLQHQQAEPPAIDELRPDVPRRLAAIIEPADGEGSARPLPTAGGAGGRSGGLRRGRGLSPLTTGLGGVEPAALAADRPSRVPWIVPSVLLLLMVGSLWLRSTAARRTGGQPSGVAERPAPGEPANSARPAPWRTVASPDALAVALAEVPQDGVVEIDADGSLAMAGFATAGRQITIRAAPVGPRLSEFFRRRTGLASRSMAEP